MKCVETEPKSSKANKERISSPDWSWVGKIVMRHSVLGPVQCQQWTCIGMRGVIVKLWAKGLGPFVYGPLSTSLLQQQANSKTRLFTRVWRSILTVFQFFSAVSDDRKVIMKSNWSISSQIGWFIITCWSCCQPKVEDGERRKKDTKK